MSDMPPVDDNDGLRIKGITVTRTEYRIRLRQHGAFEGWSFKAGNI